MTHLSTMVLVGLLLLAPQESGVERAQPYPVEDYRAVLRTYVESLPERLRAVTSQEASLRNVSAAITQIDRARSEADRKKAELERELASLEYARDLVLEMLAIEKEVGVVWDSRFGASLARYGVSKDGWVFAYGGTFEFEGGDAPIYVPCVLAQYQGGDRLKAAHLEFELTDAFGDVLQEFGIKTSEIPLAPEGPMPSKATIPLPISVSSVMTVLDDVRAIDTSGILRVIGKSAIPKYALGQGGVALRVTRVDVVKHDG